MTLSASESLVFLFVLFVFGFIIIIHPVISEHHQYIYFLISAVVWLFLFLCFLLYNILIFTDSLANGLIEINETQGKIVHFVVTQSPFNQALLKLYNFILLLSGI